MILPFFVNIKDFVKRVSTVLVQKVFFFYIAKKAKKDVFPWYFFKHFFGGWCS